jgi:glycerol-3-phosphate cytidylyltransferase
MRDDQPSLPSSGDPTGSLQSAVVGYTAGVFDMFHVGHLNLFRNARARCDLLIAGVTSDELAAEVKGERPIIPFLERMAIVDSVRYVDHVVPQLSMDKLIAWDAVRFDVLFAGDNMQGSPGWDDLERDLAQVGVQVVYLPATHVRSGELLARGLKDLVAD